MNKQNRIIITLLIITGSILLSLHLKYKKNHNSPDLKKNLVEEIRTNYLSGSYLPELKLKLLNGENLNVNEQVGKKVIILNFFASWCPPCKAELPDFQRFYQTIGEQPVLLLGISTDKEEDRNKLEKVLLDSGVTFPVGFPETSEMLTRFNIRSIPVSMVINIYGKISLIHTGAIRNPEEFFKSQLRANLNGLERNMGISQSDYLNRLANQEISQGAK